MVNKMIHWCLLVVAVLCAMILYLELGCFTVLTNRPIHAGWAAIGMIGAFWLVGKLIGYTDAYISTKRHNDRAIKRMADRVANRRGIHQ